MTDLQERPTVAVPGAPAVKAPARVKRPEIRPLTGLRALAAIAVVIHHIGLPNSAPVWMDRIAEAGFIGVPLFFMLSGFVLAYNYPTLNLRSGRKIFQFYLARIARVMPLYYAVLVWMVIEREARGIGQFHVWRHFLVIQSWSGDIRIGAQTYNAPGWSICVELFLYLLFPLLMPIMATIAARHGTRGLLAVAGGAFAVQLLLMAIFTIKGWADLPANDPASGHRWLYRNPLTRLPDFVIGISLAMLFAQGVRFSHRLSNWIQGSVLVIVPILCAIRPQDSGLWRVGFFGAFWTVPFALAIMSLASNTGFMSRFLSTRQMVTLGVASYALYLTHRPLLTGFGHDAVPNGRGLWGYFFVLCILGLCLLIAEGAHRYIEVPARAAIVSRVRRRPT